MGLFLNSKVCFCIVRCFRSMTAPSLQRCSSNSCCFDVKGVSCLLLSSSSSSLQRIPPSRPESLHLLEKLSTMQYLCSQRIPATKRSWWQKKAKGGGSRGSALSKGLFFKVEGKRRQSSLTSQEENTYMAFTFTTFFFKYLKNPSTFNSQLLSRKLSFLFRKYGKIPEEAKKKVPRLDERNKEAGCPYLLIIVGWQMDPFCLVALFLGKIKLIKKRQQGSRKRHLIQVVRRRRSSWLACSFTNSCLGQMARPRRRQKNTGDISPTSFLNWVWNNVLLSPPSTSWFRAFCISLSLSLVCFQRPIPSSWTFVRWLGRGSMY